ncbi:ATP-binding protein [Kitasatospora sp. NPDC088264]|uniref:ATP-binding protein n=1 Tax=unclassified Kitasatospora TaxID=2633591 RepID=UPI0034480E14
MGNTMKVLLVAGRPTCLDLHRGPRRQHQPLTVRAVAPDDEHGRGQFLVDELAEHWGCANRPGSIGKFVWARIAPSSLTTV